MTLTSIITLNAILGAVVVHALHHFLVHGIRSHPDELHELLSLHERESERIAA